MTQRIPKCLGARVLLAVSFLLSEHAWPQTAVPASPPAPAAQPNVPLDPFGRTTPRGTVRGFLSASIKGDDEKASQYLNTSKPQQADVALAHQLFVVLNRSSHIRFTDIPDQPEGSVPYGADPDKQIVGKISSNAGEKDVVLERVKGKNGAFIWLFSRNTLAEIPELYRESEIEASKNKSMEFLLETKIAHISLLYWLAVFIGLPLLHFLGIGLNRLLSAFVGSLIRAWRKNPDQGNPDVLSAPVRLLLLALFIRWAMCRIPLPLLARQFWAGIAFAITVVGSVWVVVRLNGWLEGNIRLRLGRRNSTGAISVLRFARWAFDALVIFVGLLVFLRYFGIKATTALAGLGVGGVAVALAAQKTLENVIAGISLVSDKALRVGDFLRVGNTLGTVTDIGLRSTRIRTLDRTVVNVPNGQIANASVETLSARDKFWFHHFVALVCETNTTQLRAIVAGFSDVLAKRPEVEMGTRHVRFLRMGTSSFDVEIFAYVGARDWPDFLRIQEEMLLDLIQIVERSGARIALPSQIMYLNPYQAKEETRGAESQDLPAKMDWASPR